MRIALSLSAIAVAVISVTGAAVADPAFNRIASFQVIGNMPADKDPTKTISSAEIIAASEDGMTLVYTDSPLKALGLIDISDAKAPKAGGAIMLGGEPTSVAVAGGKALVGVNTSKSLTEPSGKLSVVDIKGRKVEASCDLGGQPDSVAVSPDKSIIAIAIENERDEELNDGALPQMPAGYVVIFSLQDGVPDCASRKDVDVKGLAAIGGDDPEPEFVSINSRNEIVVTLQENNHLVIIDGMSGKVTAHYPAGAVDLDGVDTKRDGALVFSDSIKGALREPDAVKWLDDNRFVTANEGDYKGGSRGFTIFNRDGNVAWDSGMALEYRIVQAGHYPEKRSNKKGAEPEGVETASFGGQKYIFIGVERASIIGVYRDTGAAPEFVQLLPSGVAPEGIVAIPGRNLLVTANEGDLLEEGGLRSHVMLYEIGEGAALYPQIVSGNDGDGHPVGWGALSGLAADPVKPGILYAVNDSFYGGQPAIFTIDATSKPAKIAEKRVITRDGMPAQKLDLEGIAIGPDGGFWLVSEGRTDRLTPHAIYQVDAKGRIKQEIAFPDELLAVEQRFGSEGITVVGDTLWIAIQREWKDDAKGTVKLVSYNVKAKEWGHVTYPLEPKGKGWIGLSEISRHGDHLYIIERDNQIGPNAKLKKLFRVAASELKPVKIGEKAPVVKKEAVHDFLGDLAALNGFAVDKIEGFTVDAAGEGFAVTDNDGVDDSSGETYFFSIGKMK
ncbi:MAG: esterase-like activity of phytase family protein [Proteobacteria bacterium]|nr:esterase-like activity of phytase family protein [Pseudomonadota bacterium]